MFEKYINTVMAGNIIMFLISLITGGAMAGIIFWFFKRLRKIEEDKWGKKK